MYIEISRIAESDSITLTFSPKINGIVNIRIENTIINSETIRFFLFITHEHMDQNIIVDLIEFMSYSLFFFYT